ncbi:MAG: glycosyltransferase [Planctomycetes bacterium]|nr:glycosyltransferase [Planctomycetota bacterium]
MTEPPTFSLIVPTRRRVPTLRRLLASLAETAARPEQLEVLLVVDQDDPASQEVLEHLTLNVRAVVVPPGLTMGALNATGYESSSGRYLMLLNDDVVARTSGWDDRMLGCFRACPDEILLVHVNDLIFGDELCTFPVVSRRFCELAGGICPREYVRYRIDDHIGDVFNLLAVLGERRTFYLPDVVFEHLPFHPRRAGSVSDRSQSGSVIQRWAPRDRVYHSDPAVLAGDARRFDALFPRRKELALQLKDYLDGEARRAEAARRRQLLESIRDPFSLRVPQRLRTATDTPVTVAIVAADAEEPGWRRCLASLRARKGCELIVLDHREAPDGHVPRELNRLMNAARTEAVLLLWGPVFGAGWLDRMLGCLGPDVGVVVPPLRIGSAASAGVVFHPDGSGHYGPVLGEVAEPRPVLTFASPVALIARARCPLRFDETYRRHFFDLDLGLRVWESGLRVVCCPSPAVAGRPSLDHAPGSPHGPPYQDGPFSPEIFDADRRFFAGQWWGEGRFDRLQREVWDPIPELRGLSAAWTEAERLLLRGPEETADAFRLRAARVLRELRRLPILEDALRERFHCRLQIADCRFPEKHLCKSAICNLKSKIPRFLGKVADLLVRARRRVRREGYGGLARALARRVGLLAPPSHALGSRRGPVVLAPNPTLDAYRPRVEEEDGFPG